jgi:hypothetical protein
MSQRGDNVSEEKIKNIVNGFGEAFVKRDVEKMLSFFAEDAVWVFACGHFQRQGRAKACLDLGHSDYADREIYTFWNWNHSKRE